MPSKLFELYQRLESLKGKKLAAVVAVVFVVFTLIGAGIGYFIPRNLNYGEDAVLIPEDVKVSNDVEYKGTVVYIDPRYYPGENISFYLADPVTSEKMILLAASDEKLSVAEGLTVTIFGKVKDLKGSDEQVLIVDKLIVKQK